MKTWLSGLFSALVMGIATGLVLGSVAPSHADHELPKPPPLWSPLDELERLALIEVPHGMAEVPAGPFLMGSDPKVDPVGACVGARGARVKTIVRELGGEKIDIIKFYADPREMIIEALKPAVPREKALLVNLIDQPDLGIRRSLPVAQLPDAAREYLQPTPRVAYFFEPAPVVKEMAWV